MDRDTVVRLALEASRSKYARLSGVGIDDLMRFATLIANETLERAAKVCESRSSKDELLREGVLSDDTVFFVISANEFYSDAIRALKE